MKSDTIRKFSGGVLLAVGLATGIASAQPAAEGTFNGSSYKVFQSAGISWIAARDAAAGMSTTEPVQACYLATITSQAEDEFIEGLRFASGVSPSEVWVGGFQDPTTSSPAGANWFWLNDEGPIPGTNVNTSTQYANWLSGEPNDANGSEFYLGVGFGATLQWNDEANTGNISGYVVECDGVAPGDDVVVFNEPGQPVVSVVEEVVAPGRITQYSCVIQEPTNRKALQLLDLVQSAKNTSGCAALVAELPAGAKAYLRTYQRAFENPLNANKKDIVLTLIKSTDLDGNSANLTRGVVISEEDPELFGVDGHDCRLSEDPNDLTYYPLFVDAAVSPTAVRVNMSGEEGNLATNTTFFCNAPKSGGRYSDQLYAYPIKNRVPALAEGLLQLEAEAIGFRQAVKSVRGVCTDSSVTTTFLDGLRANFDAAIQNVRQQARTNVLSGVGPLEDVTLDALAFDYEGNCQAGYDKNAEGQFVSRLLAITYQAYRYVLFRNAGDLAYTVPTDIAAALPPFPGDAPVVVIP